MLTEDIHDITLFSDATSFNNALDLTNAKADLFLVDVMPPDGRESTLCQTTRVIPTLVQVSILMMSAHAGFKSIMERCSADDFMPKPIHIHHLSAKVNQLLLIDNPWRTHTI